jgi:hypothetical protein
MSALAHHAMKGRGFDPGSHFGVRRTHATFYASANVNGRHRQIDDGCEIGRGRVSQTRSVSHAPEGENTVRELVVLEPVDKKFRHTTQPTYHYNLLPALFGAKCAREILEHNKCYASSKFDSAPRYYGLCLFQTGNFATGGRVA